MLRSKKALTLLGNDVNLTIDNNKKMTIILACIKKIAPKKKVKIS